MAGRADHEAAALSQINLGTSYFTVSYIALKIIPNYTCILVFEMLQLNVGIKSVISMNMKAHVNYDQSCVTGVLSITKTGIHCIVLFHGKLFTEVKLKLKLKTIYIFVDNVTNSKWSKHTY